MAGKKYVFTERNVVYTQSSRFKVFYIIHKEKLCFQSPEKKKQKSG